MLLSGYCLFKTQEIKGNKLLLALQECKMMVLSCVKNI